jgi:outer membrane lipoprotein-sorting protein
MIRLFISNTYQPLAIKIEQNGQTISEINVTKYLTNQKYEDDMFRFNKQKYPNAEIIDLR